MKIRVLSAALLALPWAGSATAQYFHFSATGAFTSPSGQSVDFFFTPSGFGATAPMTFQTQAFGGGVNLAGQTISPGGIDSILTLYNGSGTQIAQNDDANDSAVLRDSLLAVSGIGSSNIPPLDSGANYHLRLSNFGSGIGDGHWSADLSVGSVIATGTLNGITLSSNATLKTLSFGGAGPGFATVVVNAGSTVAAGGAVTLESSSDLRLDGGTFSASSLLVNGGTFGDSRVFQTGGSATISGAALLGAASAANASYQISDGTYSVGAGEVVGLEGSATLTQSGGYHSAGSIIVSGHFANSGTFNLSAGSVLTSSITVGDGGYGTMNQTGGSVTISGTLALAATGMGTAAFNQSAGSLQAANAGVGNSITAAQSSWSIGSLATASVTSTLTIGKTGSVFVEGGTLSAGAIANFGGVFSFDSGTLNITAGDLNVSTFGLLGSSVGLSPLKILSVAGTTTLSSNCTLILSAGTFSTGSLSNQGGIFLFDSGTLRITNSNLTIGAAGPFGTSYSLDSGHRIDTAGSFNLTVDSGAILSFNGGSMNLGGGAVNNGQILFTTPLSILAGATLTNNGLIRGVGRVSSNLNNSISGEVRALSGDSMQFLGAANSNAGSINLFGGLVEFTGTLSNAASGRITGRGELLVRGGLGNSGSLTFSAGLSDMTGSLTNGSGGKTIVTGGATATFYDPVTNSAGSEFRVSAASTGVFLSPVVGLSYFTGPGTKDFESVASGGPVATAVGDTLVGPAGNLSAQFIHENSLQVEGLAQVLPNGTATSLSRVQTLLIPGGTLDLHDNDLISDLTSVSTIAGYIKSAYNSGAWTGNGLTSSNAAATAAGLHKTALGYATASSIGVTTFDGQGVSGSSVLVRYTYSGDANLDGVVNALDFNALASNYGAATGKLWSQADFNYDGFANTLDFNALAVNFNLALPAPALASLVPEPTAFAALLLFAFRRSRRH